MSSMIQVRNVPDAVHRELKSRSAQAGMSLSNYLLREFEQIVARPTMAQMLERLSRREPATVDVEPAAVLRAARDGR